MDNTEGLYAFLDLNLQPNTINFDNGGGESDYVSKYLKNNFNITNHVYDPYKRNPQHNNMILSLVKKSNFDTCTSNSVLNVIENIEDRRHHIKLCYDSLIKNGLAYFKIWKGNNSGIPSYINNNYQSNKGPEYYLPEIELIFGKNCIQLIYDKNLIIAKKL